MKKNKDRAKSGKGLRPKASKRKIDMVFDEGDGIEEEGFDRNVAPQADHSLLPITPSEYMLGLAPQLYNYDLQAVYRDAVLRVQQIFTGRLLGIAQTEASREEERRLLSGTLEITVPPGGRAIMTGQSQVTFRPTRVVVDDEAAGFYDVSDIKVGKNSQLVAPHPVSGAVFRAAVSQCLKMDVAQIAMYLTVELVNVSGKPRRFPSVMMFGQAMPEKKWRSL